ncbi:3'(2'),5'-bisphosphate nucleotidase CysQ [Breoghania sp. L-A4]|uniref:3'(2'),5'-bisphosphate nucleotidase CysQ n=1 Tax=Breoghania sp. L-A4 TaxID=2304600 RepID=UPI000E35F335|nr:3'(2'),5'-bisphosphate nucleotidase CysQ [Breoghania sp. L-A4]AXS39471.1 3'(2'),5'-bisphosphate nucleotidase CysQ [Breoghania sp. L-A4]
MQDAEPAITLTTAQEDLAVIRQAALEAGALALSYFRKDPKVWSKANDSPVTEADMAVDALLAERLRGARPDYGWLSEEAADDRSRFSSDRVFIVDPIDGTRGFIAGDKNWTVCIAVVEAGRPIAAAVYCPARDDMYLAVAGGGATLNDAEARVSARTDLEGAEIAGPRMITRHEAFRDAGVAPGIVVPSLALRIALVAAGRCDAAIARANAHDWDLAAADLLVHEAGGRLTALDGEPLVYNQPSIRHPALIAAPAALQKGLGALVHRAVEAA